MNSSGWKWLRIGAVYLAIILFVAGCTDTVSDEDVQEEQNYLMIIQGEAEIVGEVTGDVELSVGLYDRSSGEPVEGTEVEFEVLTEDDTAPSLTARRVYTDSDGRAGVQAIFGNTEGTWEVRADHSSANSVEFEITADPTSTGDIEIDLVHASPSIMGLSDVELRVYRSTFFDCNYFDPIATQDDQTVAEAFAEVIEEPAVIENLGADNTYTVTALARGERDQIAAGGCLDSVTVQHDETTSAQLILQLIPLNPVGSYDVVSHWDFTRALADSGPAGEVVMRVLDMFENPGEAIYSEIIELVAELVSGIISTTLDTFLSLTGLDAKFQEMINDYIDDSEGLSEVRDAGREVRDVVANMEARSKLSIGKLSSDYQFRGQDNWQGIVMYWSELCEDDDDDEDCDVIELTADEDGELGELGLVSSDWSGRVAAHNQLQIDEHTISLRYGRLMQYVLNDVMLPAVTEGNANSMADAFSYWFGCDSLVEEVISDGEICAADYCLQADTVTDFCETAISTIFGFADILINSLEYDMGLRLGGEAVLIEETSDAVVDLLEDGYYEGYIEGDGGTSITSTFDATWSGERNSQ